MVKGHAAVGAVTSEWPALLPDAMMMSRPELRLRAMSGSMVLLQPRPVLMFEVAVTLKGYMDAQDPC